MILVRPHALRTPQNRLLRAGARPLLPALAIAAALTLPLGTAAAQPAPAGDGYVRGRLVVGARAGASDANVAAALAAHGARAERIGNTELHVVTLPAGMSETAVRAALARNPMFKFVELDQRFSLASVTNDPYLGSAWHLSRIEAPVAWDHATGRGVTVAIIDTGVDASHPDLATRLVPGWNFDGNNADASDPNGHGTAVAGAAAAASNNGIGVASVAGAANIMPLRVTDSNGYATGSAIASALSWAADRGARVANVSISGAPGNATIDAAASYLRSKGGLVIVAAGNTGTNLGLAEDRTMTVVSATTGTDTIASWSSYGPQVQIAAPGDNIWTTTRGGSYGQWWGTSLASPVVAGVVALMMSARPDLPNTQIESLLYASATDLGAAGRDIHYGHGRVNAAAAVAAARAAAAIDTQAPTVAIAAPGSGAVISGVVTIDVNAADNTGVSRVELRIGGTKVATDTSAPYQFAWDSTGVANGARTVDAIAYDAAGNAKTSAAITLQVNNPVVADTTPPVVAIATPVDGSTVGSSVTIQVTSTDNAGPAAIRNTLFIDGVQVAGNTGGSLTYKWNARRFKSGSHTIQAVAVDAAGNRSSTHVTVRK